MQVRRSHPRHRIDVAAPQIWQRALPAVECPQILLLHEVVETGQHHVDDDGCTATIGGGEDLPRMRRL